MGYEWHNVWHCWACGYAGKKNRIGAGEMEAVQEHTVGCSAGQLGARASGRGRQVQDIRNYITQLDAFDGV